jgi:pimeloyl-ACP methyl ester carboxylesterase
MIVFLLLGCQVIDKQHEILENKAHNLNMTEQFLDYERGQIFGWVEIEDDQNPHQEPLVLIHGFGGDGLWTWGSNIDALAKDYRLIIPDLLWFGRSYAEAEPSLQEQSDAVWSFIQQYTQNEKVHIMGISYGGFVSLQLIQDHGSHLQSVIVVDSPGGNFDDQAIEELNERFQVSDPTELFVPTKPEQIQNLLELCMFKPVPPIPKRLLKQIYERDFSIWQDQRRALLSELPNNRNRYLTYEDPVPPMLIIWGEYDEVFPVEFGTKLSSDFQAELFVISNTRHAPNIERPKIFEKKVLEFLNRNSNHELHYKKQQNSD